MQEVFDLLGIDCIVGPSFSQQERKKNNVPDLIISQQPFCIYVETKLGNNFNNGQVLRHINSFGERCPLQTNILILLGNFDNQISTIPTNTNGVIVIAITFETFVKAIETVCHDTELESISREFRGYLENNQLLPTWMYRLDVVNCALSLNNVLNESAYWCPATGGAFSHQRSKYFGTYSDKKVSNIFEIDAVVKVGINGTNCSCVYYNKINILRKVYIARAKQLIKKYAKSENKLKPMLVFILSNMRDVNFYKDTPGGMQSSKRYFHDIARSCKTINDLQQIINNQPWSKF